MNEGWLKAVGVLGYRTIAAPLGRRRLDALVAEGLPVVLRDPALFLLGDARAVDQPVRLTVDKIEALRRSFACRPDIVTVVKPGFDSPDARRTTQAIAYTSSVSEEWGTFLHLLARATRARHILELGSCAGISGCYLAASPFCERFVTVEGSPALARIAGEHLAAVSGTARVVNGMFADVLDGVLDILQPSIDLAYIDGQKDAEGILPVVRRVVSQLRPGGLLVLDDIRWSNDLASLWMAMCGSDGFSFALDVGRFGICVRDAASPRPRVGNLARYTGWLRRTHH